MEKESVKIRSLDYKDIDEIVEIEKLILGKNRRKYCL